MTKGLKEVWMMDGWIFPVKCGMIVVNIAVLHWIGETELNVKSGVKG